MANLKLLEGRIIDISITKVNLGLFVDESEYVSVSKHSSPNNHLTISGTVFSKEGSYFFKPLDRNGPTLSLQEKGAYDVVLEGKREDRFKENYMIDVGSLSDSNKKALRSYSPGVMNLKRL